MLNMVMARDGPKSREGVSSVRTGHDLCFGDSGQERPHREGHIWKGVKGSEGFLFVFTCMSLYPVDHGEN